MLNYVLVEPFFPKTRTWHLRRPTPNQQIKQLMNEDLSLWFRKRCVPLLASGQPGYLAVVWIGTVFALALSAGAQGAADQQIPVDLQLKASDPLSKLNAAFRTAYADLRSQIVKQTSPVIIHSGDKMVLIKDGIRVEAPALSPRYHELKSVAHVPLAVYVMLVSGADSKIEDSQLNLLREYRSLVAKGRDSIERRGFSPSQRDRQLQILDRSLALIDITLQNGKVTKAELHQFAQSQKENILANAYDAAKDQITTMDRQVKVWQTSMTTEERKQLRVAVSSVHMARVGNLAMQYFSVALNEPFEGRFEEEEIKESQFRLLFTESVFDEKEILNAIGTHIVDAEIGDRFFDDRQRMHRDLLADAAEEIIRKEFRRQPSARR